MNLLKIITVLSNIVNNVISCNVFTPNCLSYYVCPKHTQISCDGNGIDDHTTYQLSLVVQENKNVENIFALFGNENYQMYIPKSYQIDGPFDSDLGGVSPSIISIFPDAYYDSWLTIGITDGDRENKLSTVGMDFHNWDDNTPIITENGAVFLMDPTERVSDKEYIIGQLTLTNNGDHYALVNVNGKKIERTNDNSAWTQNNVRFEFRNNNNIPNDCIIWYDGCNICSVNNGILSSCTEKSCLQQQVPECRLSASGH
jgi:hypothetical protein